MLVKETSTIATFLVPSIRGIRVECVSYYIRSGSAEGICSQVMRPFRDERAPKRRAGQHVENPFTVWMAKEPADDGKVKFLLESTGCVAENTWHSGRCHHDLYFTNACVLITGDVTEESQEQEPAILYVGGDTVPFVSPSPDVLPTPQRAYRVRANKRMTPTQFAEQHKGSFMLVTIRWYIVDGDPE